MKPRPFPELQGVPAEKHAESWPEGAGGSGTGTEQEQGQGALPTLGRPSTIHGQNSTAVSQRTHELMFILCKNTDVGNFFFFLSQWMSLN